MNFSALHFVLLGFCVNLFTLTVFETKAELAKVDGAVFVDLTADSLWKTVDKPAFVDVRVSAVFTSLILENSSETVKVLSVDEDLSLVDEVLLLSDLNQLKLKSIWIVDFRALVRIGYEVEVWHCAILFYPVLIFDKEVIWDVPSSELNELLMVFGKVLNNNFIVHQVVLIIFSIVGW